MSCKPTFLGSLIFLSLCVTSLLAAATLVGVVAYYIIRRMEHQVAINTFDSIADTALFRAQDLTFIKMEGASLLAGIYGSAFPKLEQWPFVSLPGYAATASRAGRMGRPKAEEWNPDHSSFAFHPLVQPEQVVEFEKFAEEVIREEGNLNLTNINSTIGFGIWAATTNRTRYRTSTGQGNGYSNRYDITAPILQLNRKDSKVFMLDLHSTKKVGPWIESLMDCSYNISGQEFGTQQEVDYTKNEKINHLIADQGYTQPCIYFSSLHATLLTVEPNLNLGVPIYPAENMGTVVGMITTTIKWTKSLTGIMPSYLEDVEAVISPCDDRNDHDRVGDSFTYVIKRGVANMVGKGDLHDKNYDEYAHSALLNDVPIAAPLTVRYKLTIYPTQQMFEQFYTYIPLAVCFGFVGIIFLCTLVFFVYDYVTMHEAQKRKAILELKRRFVRFVSHEIRTPLNTVTMGLELFQSDLQETVKRTSAFNHNHCKVDENSITTPPVVATPANTTKELQKKMLDWQDIMNDVTDNCRNSVSVLNDILSYDKIEAGTFQIDMLPVNIGELIKKTVGEFQIQATSRKISLTLCEKTKYAEDDDGRSDVEIGCRNLYVLGDGPRLAQVVRINAQFFFLYTHLVPKSFFPTLLLPLLVYNIDAKLGTF